MSFLKRILSNGIKPHYSETLKRHIEISNLIAILYIIFTVPFLLINLSHKEVLLVRSMPIFAGVIAWLLLKFNFHKLGRFIISISFPVMIYIMGVLLLIDDGTNGMAPKFWIIGSAAIPFLVFDYKEKWYIIISLTLDILLYLTFDKVNMMIDLPNLQDNLDSPRMRTMAGLGAIFLVSTIIFYVKKQLFERNEQLQKQTIELREKNNELLSAEEELKQNFEELKVLNEQVVKQKADVERYLKDLQSSISYAKSIQKAILLPRTDILKQYVRDYFILYKPKDKISGDFYYFYDKPDYLIMALGDSTGHGVPGAMMSVLGIALLDEALLNEANKTPADVLNQVREKVINYLHQTQTLVRDGFEMALAFLNKKTKKIIFSGARISMYLVRRGKIQEFKADKMPIGVFYHNKKPFSNYEIQLQEGDVIYSFSDGYIDQFGGPDFRKFSRRALLNIFEEIYSFEMDFQLHILQERFEQWKGKTVQIDDVTVIGVKI